MANTSLAKAWKIFENPVDREWLTALLADVASIRANNVLLIADVAAIRVDHAALKADAERIRLLVGGLIRGSATYDTASLNDGAGATTTVTATGAALGDFALVSLGLDVAGITVTGYVSATDTVAVRIQNESGGTLDLASTTIRVCVIPQATLLAVAALTASTGTSATVATPAAATVTV